MTVHPTYVTLLLDLIDILSRVAINAQTAGDAVDHVRHEYETLSKRVRTMVAQNREPHPTELAQQRHQVEELGRKLAAAHARLTVEATDEDTAEDEWRRYEERVAGTHGLDRYVIPGGAGDPV